MSGTATLLIYQNIQVSCHAILLLLVNYGVAFIKIVILFVNFCRHPFSTIGAVAGRSTVHL